MSAYRVSNLKVALQSGTARTLYATWSITDKNNYVDAYAYEWRYYVNKTWFVGSSGTSPANTKSSTYSPPENALKAEVRVKPIPKTYTKDKKTTDRFTGTWSAFVVYKFKAAVDNTPEIPSVPSVEIVGYNLTAFVNSYDSKAKTIEFEVVVNSSKVFGRGKAKVVRSRATYVFKISAGRTYKVRCRGINDEDTGEWSQYSGDVGSLPSPVGSIPACKATSFNSVELKWKASPNAESYTIEYTTNKNYFDSNPSQVSSKSIDSGTRAEITGLDSGEEWFFRVASKNPKGVSEWSKIVSTVLGKIPNPPTTWSSTTTAIVDNNVILYWVHNSEDGSRERNAKIELLIDGVSDVITIENTRPEDEDEGVGSYTLSTSQYTAGTKILWRVQTQGILAAYGDWSAQRTIEVYAPPTLNVELGSAVKWFWNPFNFQNGNIYTSEGDKQLLIDNILNHFPLFIYLEAGPLSQTPIGYSISIKSNDSYEDVNNIGNLEYIIAGQEIFNKYYNSNDYNFFTFLNASDISLENGMSYTISANLSMDSGLTAETSIEFTVDWDEEDFDLDCEISIDQENIIAYLRPYCDDEDGLATNGILLSVYRREFDGGFTEIASDLSNTQRPTITDPHPTLNYARYRIVGQSRYTGNVSYYDMPGYPMDETAIVLQWDEAWTSYDVINGDELADRPWNGSILKLPYNVDISDSNDIDVKFVGYIGRKNPVSYYGTQIGQKSTWNAEIKKEDDETIYALRRLAIWMGDVYVREPSGSGYWAQVKVSFNQEHVVLTVPVTLEITRVEGGI